LTPTLSLTLRLPLSLSLTRRRTARSPCAARPSAQTTSRRARRSPSSSRAPRAARTALSCSRPSACAPATRGPPPSRTWTAASTAPRSRSIPSIPCSDQRTIPTSQPLRRRTRKRGSVYRVAVHCRRSVPVALLFRIRYSAHACAGGAERMLESVVFIVKPCSDFIRVLAAAPVAAGSWHTCCLPRHPRGTCTPGPWSARAPAGRRRAAIAPKPVISMCLNFVKILIHFLTTDTWRY